MHRRSFFNVVAIAALSVGADHMGIALSEPNSGIKLSMPIDKKIPSIPGILYDLPTIDGYEDIMAWTVDDGASLETVEKYLQFAQRTGIRLTCFPNGMYPSWVINRNLLQPLLDSGQVVLGNHTWAHLDLTTLKADQIKYQLLRNEQYFMDNFGVDMKPYFRAPYGNLSQRVITIAASIGYTVPVQWYGSLGDGAITNPGRVYQCAKKWFGPQRIVIGHANQTAVTYIYDKLLALIKHRGLRSVNLRDVFLYSI